MLLFFISLFLFSSLSIFIFSIASLDWSSIFLSISLFFTNVFIPKITKKTASKTSVKTNAHLPLFAKHKKNNAITWDARRKIFSLLPKNSWKNFFMFLDNHKDDNKRYTNNPHQIVCPMMTWVSKIKCRDCNNCISQNLAYLS